mgnify:CR=1 FL=1
MDNLTPGELMNLKSHCQKFINTFKDPKHWFMEPRVISIDPKTREGAVLSFSKILRIFPEDLTTRISETWTKLIEGKEFSIIIIIKTESKLDLVIIPLEC